MDHRACPVRLDVARRRRGGRPRRARRRIGRALPRHARPPRGPQGRGTARGHAVHLPAARALHRSPPHPAERTLPRGRSPPLPGTGGRSGPHHQRPSRGLRDRGPLRRAPGRPGRSRRGARRGGLRHPHPGGRQRPRGPRGRLPRRSGLVRQELEPVAARAGELVRARLGPHRRRPRDRRGAGGRRVRVVHALHRRVPHRGHRGPRGGRRRAAAWPGWCRPPGCSRSSTGPRSATASTAATRARRSARPTAAPAGPGRRPRTATARGRRSPCSICCGPPTRSCWPATAGGTSPGATPTTCAATRSWSWATSATAATRRWWRCSCELLRHPNPLLRAHAVWAARRLGRDDLLAPLCHDRAPEVRAELDR